MLDHELEFFNQLKTDTARAAFKGMIQDCNDAIRELNKERVNQNDPHIVLSLVVEMQRQKALLRQEAMIAASKIDCEHIRLGAGVAMTAAQYNNDR